MDNVYYSAYRLPSWTPDGRALAYEQQNSVWTMGRDGGSRHMVVPSIYYFGFLGVR